MFKEKVYKIIMSSTSSTSNISSSIASGGNTKPQNQHHSAGDKRKPQISPAKRWCFTIFQFDKENWKSQVSSMFRYTDAYVVGLEKCPKTGNLHLQGYVNFAKKERPLNRFSKVFPGIHFEKTKGSEYDNYKYCSKEGDFINQNITITLPFNVKNIIDLWKQDYEIEYKDKFIDYLVFYEWCYYCVRSRRLGYPTSERQQKDTLRVAFIYAIDEKPPQILAPDQMIARDMAMRAIHNGSLPDVDSHWREIYNTDTEEDDDDRTTELLDALVNNE